MIAVGGRVGDVGGDDELVPGVHHGLDVVADLDAAATQHRATVGIGERPGTLPGGHQLLREGRVARAAVLQGRDLRAQVVRARPVGAGLGRILALELSEVAGDRVVDVPLQRGQAGRGIAPVAGIDRSELTAIDRQQLPAEEVEAPAEQDELPAHSLQGRRMVPAEIGDGLEVRGEPPQEPHQFDVAVGLLLQPAAGANAVEVAVQVEPEQVAGIVPRPPGLGRHGPLEAQSPQIEMGHKGLEEADGVVEGDVVVEHIGEEDRLGAIDAGDVRHGQASRGGARARQPAHNVGQGTELSQRLSIRRTALRAAADVGR